MYLNCLCDIFALLKGSIIKIPQLCCLQIHLEMVAALNFLPALLFLIGMNKCHLPLHVCSSGWSFLNLLKSSHRAVRSAELRLPSRDLWDKPRVVSLGRFLMHERMNMVRAKIECYTRALRLELQVFGIKDQT